MISLIKLILLLIFMIFLIIRKLKVGYVLVLATILTEILFYIPIDKFFLSVFKSTFHPKTITILVMILSILVLSNFMKEKKILSMLIENLSTIIKNRKILNICLPAFVGLLPMPGGALFSALMVEEGVKGIALSNEEKTYINYWFRHIWEYVLPLYPGIILTSGIFNVSQKTLFLLHIPFTFSMILIGYLIIYRNKDFNVNKVIKKVNSNNFINLFKSISPVLLILILSIIFNVNIAISMIITLIISFILFKCNLQEILLFIKNALKWDMLIMVLGIFYFKTALDITGAISLLPSVFPNSPNYIIIMLICLPFITGLLTGITLAYVGITFPILSVYIISNGTINLNYEMLAYVSGFIGVLLSPIHLCLLLTNEYFKSNLKLVYVYLIKSSIILFLIMMAYFFILSKTI